MSVKIWDPINGVVNAPRHLQIVGVGRASDDPRVIHRTRMLAMKVPSIEGQHRTIRPSGESHNLIVRDSLVCLPRLHRGQNIVTEPTKFQNDRVWKVLIGVEPGQSSLPRLGQNRLFNLGRMVPVVRPSRIQIVTRKALEIGQQLRFGSTQFLELDEGPNRNPRVPNAGVATSHAWCFPNGRRNRGRRLLRLHRQVGCNSGQ
nr:hypothetical protein [Humisphaera borealis]